MDFSDLSGLGINESALLWGGGALALLFFLVVAYDSIRRYRQNRGRGMRRKSATHPHDVNGLAHWFRRTRYSWKMMREASRHRQRVRARMGKNKPEKPEH